ncbi:hypothetical protein V8F33_013817 [Rhypophila sp. PSN 637]
MSSKTTKKIKPLTKDSNRNPSSPPSPAPAPVPAQPPAPPPVTVISIPDEEGGPPLNGINIVPDGDVVLDVTFDLSKETLKAARKANAIRPRPKSASQEPVPAQPPLKANTRFLYRTHLSTLKQHSKYFTSLLGDPRFTEAKAITAAFEKLGLDGRKPSQADIKDLPRVKIGIDDEATQLAGQETVFGDLLRLLHGQVMMTDPPSMAYLSTLAVLADRFGCAEPVGKSLHGQLKFKSFKWPATQVRLAREEDGVALTRAAEDLLRQKIYVSWLLDLPLRFQKAIGELIMYGSRQWKDEEDEDGLERNPAAWWYLPDELEDELKYRRACILNTIASVPQHFIALYSGTSPSRTRQCKLGYDSSASCDSYQLGETLKFLLKRNLVTLSYFSSPSSLPLSDHLTMEINHLLSILKQFPSYQIDKNHTNCGPRTRLKPILDFLTPMVSHKSVSITRQDWVKRRDEVSWLLSSERTNSSSFQDAPRKFAFTRSMAGDQRLRFEGSMGADRLVRGLFTAEEWDWTPDDT